MENKKSYATPPPHKHIPHLHMHTMHNLQNKDAEYANIAFSYVFSLNPRSQGIYASAHAISPPLLADRMLVLIIGEHGNRYC
jgi:hypothetical protein